MWQNGVCDIWEKWVSGWEMVLYHKKVGIESRKLEQLSPVESLHRPGGRTADEYRHARLRKPPHAQPPQQLAHDERQRDRSDAEDDREVGGGVRSGVGGGGGGGGAGAACRLREHARGPHRVAARTAPWSTRQTHREAFDPPGNLP